MRTFCRSSLAWRDIFERGRNEWILVFSAEDGRKILLPLSSDTYEQLLTQSNATLIWFGAFSVQLVFARF